MLAIRPFHGFALMTLGIAAACATIPSSGDPAVSVVARAETKPVGTANEDAADDPAIWRNAEAPEKSLIVGTDKKGGLYVYDLSGKELSFLAAPGLNNVDLVELPNGEVLVVASDRSDLTTAHIFLAALDTETGQLTKAARRRVGPGEGYGVCIGKSDSLGSLIIYSAPKNGVIYKTELSDADIFARRDATDLKRVVELTNALAGLGGTKTTSLTSVPSQPEGCVADPRTGTLYIGEENAGIWAINTETGEKELVAQVGTGMLVADVEGLAIAPDGRIGGHLVASSQGDNAFAVYKLPSMEPIGRFRIARGKFGGAEETDGIELDPRSFGPAFPDGLFIAQDGINESGAQNFKLARWGEILTALKAGNAS